MIFEQRPEESKGMSQPVQKKGFWAERAANAKTMRQESSQLVFKGSSVKV